MSIEKIILHTIVSGACLSSAIDAQQKTPTTVPLTAQKNHSFATKQRHLYETYRAATTPDIYDEAYVGELQEKWIFPSDHLPIGIAIDDLQMVSWNVLNTLYMRWVYENSQGLSRSILTQEDRVIDSSSDLTEREKHVIDYILSMINHPTAPKPVLCLQECGSVFLHALAQQLPEHMQMVKEKAYAKDQNILIYDTKKLELLHSESTQGVFVQSSPTRSILQTVLKDKHSHQVYRIFNVHVPGDPNAPGRYELARYAEQQQKPGETTIVVGDMNFNTNQMQDAFAQLQNPSFYCFSPPYWTNIDPNHFYRKAIDHFIINNPSAYALTPEEILPGHLQHMVDVLVDVLEKAAQQEQENDINDINDILCFSQLSGEANG
jgi:hypothetical protein